MGLQIFDRSSHVAKLTTAGMPVWQLVRDLLDHRDRGLETLLKLPQVIRSVRLGVTELTAMTWLPTFVAALQSRFPVLEVTPHVDYAGRLLHLLANSDLDLVVVPEVLVDAQFDREPVGSIDFVLAARRISWPVRRA